MTATQATARLHVLLSCLTRAICMLASFTFKAAYSPTAVVVPGTMAPLDRAVLLAPDLSTFSDTVLVRADGNVRRVTVASAGMQLQQR